MTFKFENNLYTNRHDTLEHTVRSFLDLTLPSKYINKFLVYLTGLIRNWKFNEWYCLRRNHPIGKWHILCTNPCT